MNKPSKSIVTRLDEWNEWKQSKSKGLYPSAKDTAFDVNVPFSKGEYDSAYSSAYGKGTPIAKCAHSHPALVIGDHKIYGGSCLSPIVKDADVYVGFEHGMEMFKAYPWEDKIAFMFHIQDCSVPTSLVDFRKLIDFLSTSLQDGKKVHIGCIGGHGRTGLVLSALVNHMTGNKNSIEYVRTNYCKKAVETQTQIDWLHKHFGIDKVSASKKYGDLFPATDKYYASSGVSKPKGNGLASPEIIKPVRVKGNVWGF